jgi:hypothetical protein
VSAIRELLEFIAEQAVAADLGRRLLQDEVAARRRAEREVDRLKKELDKELVARLDLQAFAQVVRTALQEQCWQATREQIETAVVDLDKLNAARKKKDEVTTCDA